MPRGFFEDPDFSKVFPTLKDEVLKITDNDKKFEISVDTHGYKPEELQVKVLDDVVTVEAKHEEKKSEENNKSFVSRQFSRYICTTLVVVGSLGILKAKQKLGVTFNFDKLGGIDFTKFSKLSMCSAGAGRCWLVQWPGLPPRHCTWSVLKFL